MLIKAILTGGVLSLLSGGLVYFGTEGVLNTSDTPIAADADVVVTASGETVERDDVTREARDTRDADVEAQDPPKKKWLDQYLAGQKPDAKKDTEIKAKGEGVTASQAGADPINVTVPSDTAAGTVDMSPAVLLPGQTDATNHSNDNSARGSDTGSFVITEDADEKTDPSAQGDFGEMFGVMSGTSLQIDYDRILEEADKLDVVDMRDSAYLEIVDYAVDSGDMGMAADILQKLSTPELRDTARARLGRGLALRGNTDAVFAVLDDVEIKELAAPIRLELISALMATRQERVKALTGQ